MTAPPERRFGGLGRAAWLMLATVASLYALFALILLPGALRPDILLGPPTPSLPDQTHFPAARGRLSQPVDPAKAAVSSPEVLARGKALYAENCQSCHGSKGQGDGAAGAALKPPPRDFTRPDMWTKGNRPSDIFRTVTRGIPGTAMAAFDPLSASDRFALAHYVQSLGDFAHAADTQASLAALDSEFSLSKGVQEPNRAPVAVVLRNMEMETRLFPSLPSSPPPGTGAPPELWGRIIQDGARAGQTVGMLGGVERDPLLLRRALAAGAPSNGFSPSIALLDASEWSAFHASLTAAIKAGEKR